MFLLRLRCDLLLARGARHSGTEDSMLTVEYNDEMGEVDICFDDEGLELLTRALGRVKADSHDHLMTPAWAGTELDERALNSQPGWRLINHVRLVRRPTW